MIELRNSQSSSSVDEASVIALCRFVLENAGLAGCDLSISLVDDAEITSLNEHYFARSQPTDVIAFPMEEGAKDGMLLGDVVVCVTQAGRVSTRDGLPLGEEISLYLIHGILHLIGERDANQRQRLRMEQKQQQLLEMAREAGKLVVASDSG